MISKISTATPQRKKVCLEEQGCVARITSSDWGNILSFLMDRDIAQVSQTCHQLNVIASAQFSCHRPTTSLFPHQIDAVASVLQHESKVHEKQVDSTLCRFRPGGIFCDDPGLGKTLSILTAVMKTRGCPIPGSHGYSKATLILVPDPLLAQWMEQLAQHFCLEQLQVRLLVVSRHTTKDVAVVKHLTVLSAFPSSSMMAEHDIVLTTLSHLRTYPILIHRRGSGIAQRDDALLGVMWKRVILDEGHSIGRSLQTNTARVCCHLDAASRWIMTGTPTSATTNQVALRHMYTLLQFLQCEPFYRQDLNWNRLIRDPILSGDERGQHRLFLVLTSLLVSHNKQILEESNVLPPCTKRMRYLDPNEAEVDTYNRLVELFLRNLAFTSYSDSHVDSLLHTSQRKHAATAVRNLRFACCIAGHSSAHIKQVDIEDSLARLASRNVDTKKIKTVEAVLYNVNRKQKFYCTRCCVPRHLPILLPCSHLLCSICLPSNKDSNVVCPLCLSATQLHDIHQLQPLVEQYEWDKAWKTTVSSKLAYLLDHVRHCSGKTIVFTQFTLFAHRIAQDLSTANISHAQFYTSNGTAQSRREAVVRFQSDPSMRVLVLGGHLGSHGLDLHAASHILIMEPIWDASLEKQVIARAHRIGADRFRPIQVETLVTKDTVEHIMLSSEANTLDDRQQYDDVHTMLERRRITHILRSLRPLRPLHAAKETSIAEEAPQPSRVRFADNNAK